MSVFPPHLIDQAGDLLDECRGSGIKIATAESCTGGLIAALLTDIAGSSDVVDRGFVTYSNDAKTEMLGVPAALIERVGAVSEEVARAMAEGAQRQSQATLSVAVTGVAGPGGGSAEKPVGLVHLACARGDQVAHQQMNYDGDRSAVRLATVETAISMMRTSLNARG